MSLVRELKKTGSPIRNFLITKFSNTRGFLADTRKQVRGSDVIRPSEDVPYPTIGTALDYRIRYYFGITPSCDLAAYKGARILSYEIDNESIPSSIQSSLATHIGNEEILRQLEEGTYVPLSKEQKKRKAEENRKGLLEDVGEEKLEKVLKWAEEWEASNPIDSMYSNVPLKSKYEDFFDNLDDWLSLNSPVRTRLAKPQEDALNRYCIVMAMMEAAYRSYGAEDSQLETSESPLDIPESHWIDDMRKLSWKFYDDYNHLLALPHTLNPTFEGSSDVGGADADLIVDGTLIDIKTTVNPRIEPDWIRQLLGYVLLDYSDRHQISSIGLYMARQGILFEWGLEDVIGGLSYGGAADIKSLREQFKTEVQRSSRSIP